ncbi:Protein kinase domain-containing protein ppk32 [Thecaphora frezii]
MSSFLSQASSYFGRTNISINYTIDDTQSPAQCGLWKIFKATRNAASSSVASASNPAGRNTVSVWVHSLGTRGQARTRVVEQLKKEASSLTRLRHPCILEVVEPLEESRNEVTFATEQVFATLQEALAADHRADVQLDEVEIQKGLLQVARGLEFLHGAKMVHQNLTPESILINAKGDWKIAGFSFLTPLAGPDGTSTPWSFPDYDPSLPPALSRNFDYLAPEYALDEKLQPENDLYSLGCIVYAVHNRGNPPFRNRNSLTNLRQHADQLSVAVGSSSWQRMGRDVLDLLGSLLTRFPSSRPNAQTFQQAGYFNSILVSTLKFMERENFAGRTKEERVQYLKGLLKILPQFSDRLLRRKVLPAVLELMPDRSLLPFILPNVFYISKNLSSIEFTGSVLPKLKPLFQIQDPPQNMLLLLDQIELFVQKTSPTVFREEVTPLLYASLEAESVMVQEKALQTVPRLAEILEYAHVKEVLFPKLAVVFAKTKVLSVKVNTLICFHSMVSILDKYTLTEKLVPILARIKTKEPSVMIATLAVHEAMSKKVDRETLATAIIPQLWIMSMGPLLNAEQFARFMKAVREMSERVEKEHTQHLKEVKRMQEHTDSYVSRQGAAGGGGGLGGGVTGIGAGGEIDFATLVGNAKTLSGASKEVSWDNASSSADPFGFDETFGRSASSSPVQASTPALTPSHTGGSSFRSSKPIQPSSLASSINRASSNSSPFAGGGSLASSGSLTSLAPPPPPSSRPALPTNLSAPSSSLSTSKPASASWNDILQPASTSSVGFGPSSSSATTMAMAGASGSSGGPNYNISLAPATTGAWSSGSTMSPLSGSVDSPIMIPPPLGSGGLNGPGTAAPPAMAAAAAPPAMAAAAAPPAMAAAAAPAPRSGTSTPSLAAAPGWGGAVLQPTTTKSDRASKGSNSGSQGNNANAWKDFDPFS